MLQEITYMNYADFRHIIHYSSFNFLMTDGIYLSEVFELLKGNTYEDRQIGNIHYSARLKLLLENF